jgi:hypothetical protein
MEQRDEDLMQDLLEGVDYDYGSDIDLKELDELLREEDTNSNSSLLAVQAANDKLEQSLRDLENFKLADADSPTKATITVEEHERIRAQDKHTIDTLKKVDNKKDDCIDKVYRGTLRLRRPCSACQRSCERVATLQLRRGVVCLSSSFVSSGSTSTREICCPIGSVSASASSTPSYFCFF